MRFLAAFIVLCFAGVFGNATISVGWATFFMLWKLYDLIDERSERRIPRGEVARNTIRRSAASASPGETVGPDQSQEG